jgi:prolyl-tRNA synthetase
MAKNITPRATDSAHWYLDVIKAAQLADYSPVKGCMVIRPEGFALWEGIQRDLDRRFKETGHVNAYFPLLIPTSFLAKEAEHVEGFALECAVVTHSKLLRHPDGGLVPAGELEEPLVIRPTSETVIGHMYAQWIQSYRDLPVLINQWANVMRWEMRTRLFLRTAEFLWQEGHTAHETAEESQEETLRMLGVYAAFVEEFLAIPVVQGRKTESEKFPGAVTTYAIEGLMQDGKALQCGTSHDLGQNFAKAFGIKFLGRDQKEHFVWTTSWGVSTRLIGALVLTHSDDDGLVLPPRVAPVVAVVVPIYRNEEERAQVDAFVKKLVGQLTAEAGSHSSDGRGSDRSALEKGNGAGAARPAAGEIDSSFFDRVTHQRILVDWRDNRPGDKHFHWEQRGVPFRIEVGPRDAAAGTFVLKHRLGREKETVSLDAASGAWLRTKLEAAQRALFERALTMRTENTRRAESYDELKRILAEKGGFVRCYFEPDRENEAKIKEETKATVRCIPFDQPASSGRCILSGKETKTEVLFAIAY